MHGQSLVDSAVVKDLVVTVLNSCSLIELLRAYTRNEIPVSHEQIPTTKIISRIEHLTEIANKIPAYNQELDIGLLIGSKCPTTL